MNGENIDKQSGDAAVQEVHDAILKGQEQIRSGEYADGPEFMERLRMEPAAEEEE